MYESTTYCCVEITDLYVSMIKESWENGSFPVSFNTGIISLIHKNDQRDDLKNYRPITLTNCDYKILAFVFAERLQNVFTSIVHTDQVGYIRQRFIGCSIRNIIDIYKHLEENDIDGAILCIDFAKAFDTVEHEFIYKTLEKFNFGENFISWIKIFYRNPVFRIKNNGWISGRYNMSRGIRQGCPMSALLFIIAIEVMAIDIRENKKIHGINFGNYEHKICQYADDATIMIKDLESVSEVVTCINCFSKYAGPELNLTKTKGIWLGPLKDLGLRIYCNIVWTGKPIKCLGIYIGHDSEKCFKLNWLSKIQTIESVLKQWAKRKLSLFGKIEVIKRYALSKIVFPASILETSKIIEKKLSTIFHTFIWGKKDRIKRSSLKNNIEHGGLNMVDIEAFFISLKAAWIARFLSLEGKWRAGIETIGSKLQLPMHYVLNMNFKCIEQFPALAGCNLFYVNILIAFNKCKFIKSLREMNELEILSSPLWGNSNFAYANECIYFKEWINSNILYVKDLIDETGAPKSENIMFNVIRNKTKIIEQLYKYKNSVYKRLKNKTLNIATFTQISDRITLLFHDKLHDVEKKKSKFFYLTQLGKNEHCKMESIYSREFGIHNTREIWKNVYRQKLKEIKEVKLKEFNFKLLHNIVPCGKILSKWKANILEKCDACNEIETTKHMLFDCLRVNSIWKKISDLLKFNIKWENVIIGIPIVNEIRSEILFYNTVMSITAYAIFKENSHCKFTESCYESINLEQAVVRNLQFYGEIRSCINENQYHRIVHLLNNMF